MNQPTMRNPTLFDLLARTWRLAEPVTDARFSTDGGAVAFAGAGGALSIAGTLDGEPPEKRIRISGDLAQTTIRPRETPVPPIISVPGLGAVSVPICARAGGFLAGDGAGRVLPLQPDGTQGEAVMWLKRPAVAIDHAGGVTAATDGAAVRILRPDLPCFLLARDDDAPVTTLALSADGDHLALTSERQIEVWVIGDEIMRLDVLPCAGRATSISWHPSAPWLACGLEEGGFTLVDLGAGRTHTIAGFPMPVRSIAWSRATGSVAASGAYRIAAWTLEGASGGAPGQGALETGRAGMVPVEAVAAHPAKTLIAAGYANGQVVVAQIGRRDELVVRAGGGPITALEWSPDGNHLAVGDGEGVAAIVTFPGRMFK